MPQKYSTRQSLPIFWSGSNLHIGVMPPNARVIESAPVYLGELLYNASTPKSHAELVGFAVNIGVEKDEASLLVDDLIQSEILINNWINKSERYSRHDLYLDLAANDTRVSSLTLREKIVSIVGVGGVGTNVAMQLSAAGVGRIILVDHDRVEESNLTRQFLFNESDVGRYKVDAAKDHLCAKNSDVDIVKNYTEITSAESLLPYFTEADLVILSADKPEEVIFWANTACHKTKTAFTGTGYQDTVGIVGPLVIPGKTPCMVCVEKNNGWDSDSEKDSGKNINSQYQAPSFGPLNAIVSGIQSAEAIKYLLGVGIASEGRRIAFDSITTETWVESYNKMPECVGCSFE